MKRGIVILFLVMICISFISAIDTSVKIKTLPNHNVNINALNSNYEPLDSANVESDSYGDVSLTISTTETRFDLTVYVKKDGKKVAYEQFKNNVAGEALDLEVIPEGAEIIETPAETGSNETSSTEETNTSGKTLLNESENTEPGIIGATISKSTDFVSKHIYYILGGALLIGGGFFVFRKMKNKKGNIQIKKLSEIVTGKIEKSSDDGNLEKAKDVIEDKNAKIDKIEGKLKELQDMLEDVRKSK